MNKTIIVPLVGVLVIAAKLIFGVNVSEDLQQQIADWLTIGASLVATVYGIFKNHKKGE
jgi:fructose-specific phosphotransferase system IIC component